jgi:integrase
MKLDNFKIYRRSKKTRQHGTSYWVEVHTLRNGERHVETIHLGYDLKPREIDSRLNLVQARLFNGTWGSPLPSEIGIEQLCGDYLESVNRTNLAPATIESIDFSLKYLKDFFKGMKAKEINESDIEKFFNNLKCYHTGLNLAPRSKNIILTNCRKLYQWAIKHKLLFIDPTSRIKKQTEKIVRRSKALNIEQIERLWNCDLTPWQQAYLRVLIGTGLRPGELLRLEFAHLDWDRKEIFIPATKRGADNGTIPMSLDIERQLRWLQDYLPHLRFFPGGLFPPLVERTGLNSKYIFCHPDGRKVDSISKSFKSAMTKAHIVGVTPHGIRRTFATLLRSNGNDAKVAQRLLRHKNVSTTLQIYTEVDDASLRKGVESIPNEQRFLKERLKVIK